LRLDWSIALPAMLLAPLALAGYLLLGRRPSRYAVSFTNLDLLAACVTPRSRWKLHLPAALVLLSLVCATTALARPAQRITTANAHGSVVLVVDNSGSMAADDVVPTRIAAARQAIAGFLARLPHGFRVGLVVFSSEPYVASPLTSDHSMVLDALAMTDPPGAGTALGDALARSVALLRPQPTAETVGPARRLSAVAQSIAPATGTILLLSDGAQTRGRLAPLAGAALAEDAGIPVHTVALGTPAGTISEGVISLRVPPDPATLRRISIDTGGDFHTAMDERALDTLYAHLATQLGWETHWRELAPFLLALAAAFGLAACGLAAVSAARVP
jgi:Ca-activated chloride channel family protein